MKNLKTLILFLIVTLLSSCASNENQERNNHESETHDYFLLRPKVEKSYGYSHAVKIGDELIISGAVSMNDSGYPTAVGDLA